MMSKMGQRKADDLQMKAEKWLEAVGRRQHATAETELCDPRSSIRQKLINETRKHSRYDDKYAQALKKLQPLEEHASCAGPWEGLMPDTQDRARMAIAMDCEMIETAADDMALARVSAVDAVGRKVLDELVLPCEPSFIEDCRTAITGIEKVDLVKRGISVEEARNKLASCCSKDTVIIGHALDHDLLALGFRHDLVIDTSHIFPVQKNCDGEGREDILHSLDYLSKKVLRREMDRGGRGGVHDSLEDARNSLDLVKYAIVSLLATGFETCPPIPQRARQYRAKGSGTGFLGSLHGRQAFASKAVADMVVGRTEDITDKFNAFYSLQLQSSASVNCIKSDVTAIAPPVSRPTAPTLSTPLQSTSSSSSVSSTLDYLSSLKRRREEAALADAEKKKAVAAKLAAASKTTSSPSDPTFRTGEDFFNQQKLIQRQISARNEGRARMEKLKARFLAGPKKKW